MDYPKMTERELQNAALSRKAAAEGMVLLKNDGSSLPLKAKTVALFGGGAVRTVRGGTGSGDPFNGGVSGGGEVLVNQNPRYHINILDAFVAEGYNVVNKDALEEYGRAYDQQRIQTSYNPMAVFAFPEYAPEKAVIDSYAAKADTAIYVLSRNTGEGHDRSMLQTLELNGKTYTLGDYNLSDDELEQLKLISAAFPHMILVLNAGGSMDMTFPAAHDDINAILFMCQAGQEGGPALLDVLTGRVTPSGKLTTTWPKAYTDFPDSATFGVNDGNVETEKYEEGIFVGYRYFDTFGVEPLYEFGYGLSYTDFAMEVCGAALEGETLTVSAKVKNIGAASGKEVLQLYCSSPDGKLEKPFQALAAYKKTQLLTPGEEAVLEISVKLSSLASYDEETASWLLEKGGYRFRLGNSSKNTVPVCTVTLNDTVIVEKTHNEMALQQELTEISARGIAVSYREENYADLPAFTLEDGAIVTNVIDDPIIDGPVTTYTTDKEYKALLPYEVVEYVEKKDVTLLDVIEGKATLPELVAQMSLDELAALNCGTGWGVANDDAPIVGENSATIPGAAGETLDLWDKYRIPSMVLADGPGGVRVHQSFEAENLVTGKKEHRFQLCNAWPVGTLLAQSFDDDLLYEVGTGFAKDMEAIGVSLLLGPGMNIHRDPLCGRNFEYFSEDPLLTGKMAAAIVRGVQSGNGTGACIKHFAANNQEVNRNRADSVVSERALREIYLKGFEIAVKESSPLSLMTSYNRINGTPAADHHSMNTNILRGEWKFDGLVMTDWNGGMSTPFISMHAGNDLIMPGGGGRIMNILMAAKRVEPQFEATGAVATRYEKSFMMIPVAAWNSFVPAEGGSDSVSAEVLEGKPEFIDNQLHINGKPQFAGSKMAITGDGRPGFVPINPITEKMAMIADDGKTITYFGNWTSNTRISLGDIQRCAMNNISVAARSFAMKKRLGK